RMLDMGFLPDVRRVVGALPKKRQTLFFSATMPPEIRDLANTLLHDPVSLAVTPVATPAERIEQRLYFVDKNKKRHLLVELLTGEANGRTLVFSRTKHGANRIVKELDRAGLSAAAIHGNKSQGARTRALEGFRGGDVRILVATDIAARGIDVEGIEHVINFDLPNVPETYVHRIGRTARAGAEGIALSLCDDEERAYLVDIERLMGRHIDRIDDHPFRAAAAPPPLTDLAHRRGAGSPGKPGSSGKNGQRQAQATSAERKPNNNRRRRPRPRPGGDTSQAAPARPRRAAGRGRRGSSR
ncbi:MAG: ATP-dependent helicase, partial [Myxococcales bacterium]|nr:ATP-dependent helicase [Myxococcales bacterium]